MKSTRALTAGGKIKDLHMTVKLANNQIRQRREEMGLSVRDCANACGVEYVAFLRLEGMRKRPTRRVFSGRPSKGAPRVCVGEEWSATAHKIAKFFSVTPEDLFPDAVLAINQSKVEMRVTAEQVAALAAEGVAPPDARLEAAEARAALSAAISRLRPREQEVLRLRYGLDDGVEKTLAQIGEIVGVCAERVRGIEAGALARLRSPKSGLRGVAQ